MVRALVAFAAACTLAAGAQSPAPRTHLVIVVDGLRPDYVTTAVMPRLFRLGQRGTLFAAHHSVFPTVTRVNAPSFVTGAYPETHGVLGNTIYLPAVDATTGLDTGLKASLEAVERAEGRLLTAPTLGELLRPAGKTVLAASSGSAGVSWLLNSALPTGAIVHYDFARPADVAALAGRVLGAPPPAATPNDPGTSTRSTRT